MTTALKIIKSGFRKATINAGLTPLTDFETSDALEIMNDWLIQQNALGVLTGVDPVVALDTDLFEPRWATETIKLIIGLKICTEFGRPITQGHAAEASSSYNTMLTISQPVEQVVYPDNLPTGSGNHDQFVDDYWNEDFFPPNITPNF